MEILKQSSATREDLGLLAVMEAIEEKDQTSQREIARETGLNLKKVNYALHKLLEKGYVKFQKVRDNPDKRAYLYILTPSGVKAKSQLTYRFLKFTLDFYNKVEQKLQNCLMEMEQEGVGRVLLYGATDTARIVLDLTDGKKVEVVGVLDDAYEGSDFYGVPSIHGENIDSLDWDRVLVTALDGLELAQEKLRESGVDEMRIITLS